MRWLIAAVLAVVATDRVARADLWEVFVQDTGGMGVPDLLVTGDSLLGLVEDLVNTADAFAGFSGTTATAGISYAGIQDVITVTVDPLGGTATLEFTILGAGATTFNFSGADLAGQIEQFIQDNLSQQITAFIQQINQLSLIAVTDGSPMSSTALAAGFVYDRFGLHGDLTGSERRLMLEETEFKPGLRGRFDTYGDRISTDVGDGNSLSIVTSLEYAFDRTLSVALMFPINYIEVEGSDIINTGATVAVPFTLIRPDSQNPLGLRVVPFGTLTASGSADLVAGGLFGSGGALATVLLDFEQVTMSGTVQLSHHEGITLRYGDFEFDPGVDQNILKAGGKLTLRSGDYFYVYGAVTFTQFLNGGAVDHWLTPAVGFGYRDEHNFSVTVGYSGDIADGYQANGLRAIFQLPF